MVMAIEYDIVDQFTQQSLTLLQFIPLNYWLENFNFNLCNADTLSLLAEAVELNINVETSCKLMKAIEDEGKITDEIIALVDKKENAEVKEMILEDGTLATVARNHWRAIVSSTWPCSQKRPFSLARRQL